MQYYQNLVTEKSFEILKDLKRKINFILIGGWAVFLYTHSLKSKDIDIILEYEELEKIREKYILNKNERLKKYEIVISEIDIDIYLPYYSNPGLPAEEVKKYTQNIEGFQAPLPEVLLILKQKAYLERFGTSKGEKDRIDIISILKEVDLDFNLYKKILEKHKMTDYVKKLKELLEIINEAEELDLNQFQYSKLKKNTLEKLK